MSNTFQLPTKSHADEVRERTTNVGMRYLAMLAMIALIATLTARVTGYKADAVAPSPEVFSRGLLFTDLGQGFIDVHDAIDNTLLLEIGPGEEAFLRSVVRGLARQRRAINDLRDVPFKLSELADGRLVISDPISGDEIQLDAFGEPNLTTFSRLLHGDAQNQGSTPTFMATHQ